MFVKFVIGVGNQVYESLYECDRLHENPYQCADASWGIEFVLEGKNGTCQVVLTHERSADIWVMNDTGKTIEHRQFGPHIGELQEMAEKAAVPA